MENNYNQDWEFKKFEELIDKKEDKQKLFNLYDFSSSQDRKRLFLYLSFEESNDMIRNLLEGEGLLTMNGIDTSIEKNKLFIKHFEFICKNKDCKHGNFDNLLISTKYKYSKCPVCGSAMSMLNQNELINTFFALYLNYFDFYLLNDSDKTLYLIRNKYNGKTYLKNGDEPFANWIYIKLIENDCDIGWFLFGIGYSGKNVKNELLRLMKENKFIKTIDNLNFKPTLETTFRVENKKYFNIYTGNKYLNRNIINKDMVLLKDCQNIYDLLYNLTGKSDVGVDYLLDVLAMVVQEPWIKTKQLIIFYGEEAAGKGTFYDLILAPLFEGYITKILGKKIKSNFNGFMSKNLVLVLEEVKSDKEEEDTLKELVTEDTLIINTKNMPEREEQNYLTVFGFSNEQNPISVGKRRGVYFRSRTLGGSTDKAPIFRKKYEENIPKEFNNFIDILKTREYNRVKVMSGIETDAKQQVLDQNKSVIERFYDLICCFDSIKDYLQDQQDAGILPRDYDLSKYLYKFKEINYVDVNFMLELYNQYLKQNKYNQITLNKFSEFWQLSHIDRDNKEHWRRLTPSNKKIQYVNLDKINTEIKLRFDGED